MGVDGHKKEEEGDKAVGHYCSSMKEVTVDEGSTAEIVIIHADRHPAAGLEAERPSP